MTRGSVRELVVAIRGRYEAADRAEKGRMLKEFCASTGYHPKSAIRLLRRGTVPVPVVKGRGRQVRYGASVRGPLRVAWEVLGRPCGKRLAPFLPELVQHLERHGELAVDDEVRGLLTQVSASTIDRLLAPYRLHPVRRPFTQGSAERALRQDVVIKTFAEWTGVVPGQLQADLVAHCGATTAGFYLTTLVAVDVATGWCGLEVVWGKGQQRVGTAVHRIRERLPFHLQSLHTDNGSEFLNRVLMPWCRREGIVMTRGRPYRKNDQAWVEQKNDTTVRRLVGYDRFSSERARHQFERVYALAEAYFNFFQPVGKLLSKHREGARVVKRYDLPRTPYQRVLLAGVLEPAEVNALAHRYARLNPVRLRQDLDRELRRLFTMAEPSLGRASSAPSVTPLSEAATHAR